MSAEPKNPDADIPPVGHAAYEDGPDNPTDQADGPLADLRKAREDRIAKIKADIEAGGYDSDELLAAALGRMLQDPLMDEEDDLTKEENP